MPAALGCKVCSGCTFFIFNLFDFLAIIFPFTVFDGGRMVMKNGNLLNGIAKASPMFDSPHPGSNF
jgi:hypothetical protein